MMDTPTKNALTEIKALLAALEARVAALEPKPAEEKKDEAK